MSRITTHIEQQALRSIAADIQALSPAVERADGQLRLRRKSSISLTDSKITVITQREGFLGVIDQIVAAILNLFNGNKDEPLAIKLNDLCSNSTFELLALTASPAQFQEIQKVKAVVIGYLERAKSPDVRNTLNALFVKLHDLETARDRLNQFLNGDHPLAVQIGRSEGFAQLSSDIQIALAQRIDFLQENFGSNFELFSFALSAGINFSSLSASNIFPENFKSTLPEIKAQFERNLVRNDSIIASLETFRDALPAENSAKGEITNLLSVVQTLRNDFSPISQRNLELLAERLKTIDAMRSEFLGYSLEPNTDDRSNSLNIRAYDAHMAFNDKIAPFLLLRGITNLRTTELNNDFLNPSHPDFKNSQIDLVKEKAPLALAEAELLLSTRAKGSMLTPTAKVLGDFKSSLTRPKTGIGASPVRFFELLLRMFINAEIDLQTAQIEKRQRAAKAKQREDKKLAITFEEIQRELSADLRLKEIIKIRINITSTLEENLEVIKAILGYHISLQMGSYIPLDAVENYLISSDFEDFATAFIERALLEQSPEVTQKTPSLLGKLTSLMPISLASFIAGSPVLAETEIAEMLPAIDISNLGRKKTLELNGFKTDITKKALKKMNRTTTPQEALSIVQTLIRAEYAKAGGSTGLSEDELEAYLASEVISLFAEGLLREKNPTIYELLNVPTTHGTGHDPYWI